VEFTHRDEAVEFSQQSAEQRRPAAPPTGHIDDGRRYRSLR
jgi:hypothetical protein